MCRCCCFSHRTGKCFYRNTIISCFIRCIHCDLTFYSVYGKFVAGLFPNQLVYILYHFTICAKVEFITIYIFPSGCHGTVCAKVIPASINSLPGICQFASIRSLIVPGISGFHPVGISIRVIIRNPFSICSNPVRTNPCVRQHITISANIIVADPAIAVHRTTSAKVIPLVVDQMPAGTHHITIAWVQVIPGSSQIDPTGCHRSASRQIIPGSSTIQPAGLHRSASIGIIPYTFHLIPAGFHSTVFTHVVPGSANIDPAGCQRSVSIYPVPGSIQLIPAGST